MKEFNHYVGIKVNRWGKGLLGDNVQIEEWDNVYFSEGHDIKDAYKVIDRLLRAGKREDITISLYEGGNDVQTVRRLFVRLDYGFRAYGVADVAECDDRGYFDYLRSMDLKATRKALCSVLDNVAMEQKKSEVA